MAAHLVNISPQVARTASRFSHFVRPKSSAAASSATASYTDYDDLIDEHILTKQHAEIRQSLNRVS